MSGLALLLVVGAAGLFFGLPRRLIAAVLALIWLAIVLLHLTSPQAGAMFGGSLRGWLFGGVLAVLVVAYRVGLGWLRRNAIAGQEPPQQAADTGLTDPELDRYARHLVLREIGGPGQMKLRQAKVLVVGAGGLGAPVCLYLAAAGVGRITVSDGDTVSVSNLQRQVIFQTRQRGEMKADAAAANMADLNPHVEITPVTRALTDTDLPLIAGHDLVLDGTDSFATRDLVNRLCVEAEVPLLSGSIAQWEGQVTLYDPARGAPCLACIFPEPPAPGLAPACAEAGVVGPLPGVIGSMMALEAIKHLTGAGQGLAGRLLLFDGLYGETRMIGISRRANCPVCGSALEATPKAT
ncbi:molybdopterin-synthase adenylyltransferase MoeB [Paracoccus caeni]|uniref:Molybdopterin-synthase adenylyltransferase n=1 Tax=Paracoccus caeni TaxID=657651 RepID=A0A934W009_9RHOB|nr:molybdopterin-synthase adenylyltransferase MoeB [Paracoccus caeni]MBK4215354.1 molybdopterin-synthase adenylyltransferase MoeB [Paracoccus caeni]